MSSFDAAARADTLLRDSQLLDCLPWTWGLRQTFREPQAIEDQYFMGIQTGSANFLDNSILVEDN